MAHIYRVHAIERMFQRNISNKDVETAIQKGEIIESYENDKPYPSFLILYTIEKRPIHVVFAYDDNENIVVTTTYIPHNTKWENDFKTRRPQ